MRNKNYRLYRNQFSATTWRTKVSDKRSPQVSSHFQGNRIGQRTVEILCAAPDSGSGRSEAVLFASSQELAESLDLIRTSGGPAATFASARRPPEVDQNKSNDHQPKMKWTRPTVEIFQQQRDAPQRTRQTRHLPGSNFDPARSGLNGPFPGGSQPKLNHHANDQPAEKHPKGRENRQQQDPATRANSQRQRASKKVNGTPSAMHPECREKYFPVSLIEPVHGEYDKHTARSARSCGLFQRAAEVRWRVRLQTKARLEYFSSGANDGPRHRIAHQPRQLVFSVSDSTRRHLRTASCAITAASERPSVFRTRYSVRRPEKFLRAAHSARRPRAGLGLRPIQNQAIR